MILITGATEVLAKVVLQEWNRKESKVRAMYRSKEEAARPPSGCEARACGLFGQSRVCATLCTG